MKQTRIRRSGRARALLAIVAVGLLAPPPQIAAAGTKAPGWDFDGDGRRDFAIGVVGENDLAGGIAVMRGTRTGLDTEHTRRFSQDSPGIPGVSEPGDVFGGQLASGDFDADGYADLAVSATGEDSGTVLETGSVRILYGSPKGLTGSGAHALARPQTVFGSTDRESSYLGFGLAAGDFDDDGDDDLAATDNSGVGGILVYRGRAAGLATLPFQQIGPGYGFSGLESWFPDGMDVGDLDGNGVTDLAVGSMEATFARGAVVVLYGAPGVGLDVDGPDVPEPQVWTEDSPGVKGVAEDLDAFGSAIGIGDVTGDGRMDLVVAVLQQPIEGMDATGALHVLRGSASGVTDIGDQYVTYDALVNEPVGALGVELEVGRLDGDGVADIAVTRGSMDAHRWGSVLVIYGSPDGIAASERRSFTQTSTGIEGRFEPVDYWGDALAIRDVGRTRAKDLIVGDPFEDVDGVEAGMVTVQWGSDAGVSGAGPGVHQETEGVPGVGEDGDRFGSAV